MHLYVHVPFCARRCSYCDFAIAVRREVPSARYVAAVGREWQRRRAESPVAGWTSLQTLYFGGGTPSRLATDALAELIERLTADTPLVAGAEVTLEVNPDDVSMSRAEAWRAAGVNRISLGVQSHHPAVLTWMHRTHTAEQVPEAVGVLRDTGFDNISVDLIFALPRELARDWSRDLDLTLALDPDHLSLYGLTVEPMTPLGRWTARGEARPASDERYADEYLMAHHRLRARGFEHYEVSNAGRPRRHAVHNRAYWRGVDFLGIGPGAHSLLAGRRQWNIRDWAAWERAVATDQDTLAGGETLSEAQRALEQIYLGLRTSEGLAARAVPAAQLASWVAAGWAQRAGDRIRLSAEGWLRLDALVAAVGAS
jgi:oxygen-independent coproporphyrinogen-3 oxidase